VSALSRSSVISDVLPRIATKWIVVAAIAAFIAKAVFAMTTFGTNDILFYHASWQRSLAPDGGFGLYRDGIELVENGKAYHSEHFRNPPFVINILRAAGWLTDVIGFHFFFWLKMPSILADIGILWVLWRLLEPHTPAKRWALLIIAASPVSYLISGFHGSTDAVMIFFVLLSLLVFQRVENPFYAGLAYGMSMNIKIWPLLLIPAVLAWLPAMRRRAQFLGGVALILAIGSAPWFYQAPLLVLSRLLGYDSVYGNWGIPQALTWFAAVTGFDLPNQVFRAVGKYLTVGVLAAGGVWLQKKYPSAPLPLRLGCLASLFFLVTSGFGVQYLAWIAPWGVFLGPEVLLLFNFSAAVFLTSVYNYWGGDFPWRLANSLNKAPYNGVTIGYDILCWASILALFLSFLMRIRAETPATVATPQPAPVVAHAKPRTPARPPRDRKRKSA
jgi:hypothetical protein